MPETYYAYWNEIEFFSENSCTNGHELEFLWDAWCDDFENLMKRINPENKPWFAKVKNFGWRKQDGEKTFVATNAKDFLRKILPETECSFYVYDKKDHIAINNFHHDSPTGSEWYYITPDLEAIKNV